MSRDGLLFVVLLLALVLLVVLGVFVVALFIEIVVLVGLEVVVVVEVIVLLVVDVVLLVVDVVALDLVVVDLFVFVQFVVFVTVGRLTKLDGFMPGECPELHVKAPPQGGADTVETVDGIITNAIRCLAPFDPAFCGTISQVVGASVLSGRCSSAAEQGSHKPRVGGSIPPTATTLIEQDFPERARKRARALRHARRRARRSRSNGARLPED